MSAGTIRLTNNSTAIVGTGTTFTSDLKAGDVITSTVGGVFYTLFVDTVTSNTAATLTDPFTGPTTTGASWVAVPQLALNRITAALATQTAEAVRRILQDNANWQAFYSGSGDIVVTLPDGTPTGRQITGPSWSKLMTTIGTPRQFRGDVGTADLNTIDGSVEGDYNQPRNSSATASRNYPVNLAGSLRVYSTNANNIKSCIQEYDVWDRNNTYTRCGVSTAAGVVTWTDWSEVSAGALRSTLIASTTDLDTLNSLAYLNTYRVSAGTLANHYPYEGFAGTIEVVQGYSNGVQQFAVSNYGNTFMRYMSSATVWSAWINTGMAAVPGFFTGNADDLLDDGDYPTNSTTTGLPDPALFGGTANPNNCRLIVRSLRSNTSVTQDWIAYGTNGNHNGRRFHREKYATNAWTPWQEMLDTRSIGNLYGIGASNPSLTGFDWQNYAFVNGASYQVSAPSQVNPPVELSQLGNLSLGVNVLGMSGDPSSTTAISWCLMQVSTYVNGTGSTRRLFHVVFRGTKGNRSYSVLEILAGADMADARNRLGAFPAAGGTLGGPLAINTLANIRTTLANLGFSQASVNAFDIPGASRNMRVVTATAVVTTNSAGNGTVTFPSAFPNACMSVVASHGDRNGVGTLNVVGFSTGSITGFNFYAEGVINAACRVNYIAVGY